MTELEQALSKLSGVKKLSGGWMARCPCHDDREASLSLKEEGGKLLLFCHAGCSFADIIKELGLKITPIVDKIEVAHYDYLNAQGQIQYRVVRYEPKDFRQCRPDGAGGWVWDLKGVKPVLYNLPQVLDAKTRGGYILFVEGEKDCQSLAKIGVVATTSSGGSSGKWKPEYTDTLQGAKVAVIPDNDESGKKYARRVADSLFGYVASLRWIDLPEVGAKGDVSDWLAMDGNDKIRLARLLNNAPEYTPAQAVSRDEFTSLQQMVRFLNKEFKKQRYSKPKRRDGV